MSDPICTYTFPASHPVKGDCGQTEQGDNHDPEYHTGCVGNLSDGCMLHEFKQAVTSIDISPSDEGYAAIAETFLANVLGDVLRNRQEASRDLLHQALTIVGHLAQHDQPALAKRVIDSVLAKT